MTRAAPPVGFLVWNPSRNLPTCQHHTYEQAAAERDRLQALHPTDTFYVMAPAMSEKGRTKAQAFSDGQREGLAQAHREIMTAEANADRNGEKVYALENRLRQLGALQDRSRTFQATVADCLLWFDGYAAAFAIREPHERPRIPDRDKLVDLNAAFQRIVPVDVTDDEIPF